MRHIGILAHSADGAALCFVEACRDAEYRHPEITMSILPMGEVFDAYERGDFAAIGAYLARTAQRLADAGCDFFACADNTAHLALEAYGPRLPLPGLHVAELVARRARADRRACVGLLGTRLTMEGSTYRDAFARAGVALRVPPPDERARVSEIIFAELCHGVLRDSSRAEYVRVIERLRAGGCDAVVLGCTEIPLLVTPDVSPLPTLDSTRLLAREAVRVERGEAELPTWRGGPP